MYLCADFETTILKKGMTAKDVGQQDNLSVEVWLSCFCEVGQHHKEENYHVQTDIKQFFRELIQYCETNNYNDETIIFFHNLKFDGSYICNMLFSLGIEFKYFIDEMGQWFNIEVLCDNCTLVFKDSLKVLNFSLDELSRNVLENHIKGETPLLETKPKIIKPEWYEYMINDVRILCFAIDELYHKRGFEKFTSASEALRQYKKTIDFTKYFPCLTYDEDRELRVGYKGAWTYVKESIANIPINKHIKVFDENSKYPTIMLNRELPYGYPEKYPNKLVEPKNKQCAVYKVLINFDLKDGFLPTLQAQSPVQAFRLGVKTTTYLKTTDETPEWFVLTNYDLELLKKHYYVDILECEWTRVFKTKKGLFSSYIQKYQKEKEYFKELGDNFGVLKAKIMLNSLYGKFGAKTESRLKELYQEDGTLKFKVTPLKIEKPIYLPIAMFITSIGRYDIITDAQNNYNHFLYSDTDSLHLIDNDNINLDIDPSRFGAWDLEKTCIYGKYIRAKLNLEIAYTNKKKLSQADSLKIISKKYYSNYINGVINRKTPPFYYMSVTGAGMTKEVKKLVTKENFKIGFFAKNAKKTLRQVKNGVAIVLTDFEIKDNVRLL